MDKIEAYRKFLEDMHRHAGEQKNLAPPENVALWFGYMWWAGAESSWEEALERLNKDFPKN